jgi:CubicO group peptidase (beta-lactamase class C family)
VVEAASGRPIEAFCAEELFGPLGMGSTAFDLDDRLQRRLARAWSRAPDGGFAPLEIAPPPATEFRGMGDALYSTPADYLRFVRLFLGGGTVDGVRVLSEASVAEALANQIGALRVTPMVSTSARVSADVAFFPGVALGHWLLGPRVETDVPGMRRAGAQGWSGLLNMQWWVDPRVGLAALLMTQTLPFMEPRFAATYAAFERAVYAG